MNDPYIRETCWDLFYRKRRKDEAEMNHLMDRTSFTADGWRWDCPVCGRIVIITSFEPLRKKALIEGDTTVSHTLLNGAAGSLRNVAMKIEAEIEEMKGE